MHPQTIASNGFMGKSWDGSKVAYDISTWAEVLRVLKPGAFAMMFGGSRTFHRVTCAIEDAGFEIRDLCLFLHAKGFPKNTDLSKAIDKRLGKTRKVVGYKDSGLDSGNGVSVDYRASNGRAPNGLIPVTEAASAMAKRWTGFGSALKPAHEPIILARRYPEGALVDSVLAHETGGLDIDGSRIGKSGGTAGHDFNHTGMFGIGCSTIEHLDAGRWPANVMFDEEAAAMLGGAARFFYTAKAATWEREAGCEDLEKAIGTDRSDGGAQHTKGVQIARNHHPTIKPLDLIRYFAKMILPPKRATPRRILVPFSGSGSEMIGCLQAGWDEVVGIERESEYIAIAKHRIAKGGVFSQLQDRHMRRAEPSRAEPRSTRLRKVRA